MKQKWDKNLRRNCMIHEKGLSEFEVWKIVEEWYLFGLMPAVLQDENGLDLEEIINHLRPKIGLEEHQYVINPKVVEKTVVDFRKWSIEKLALEYFMFEARVMPRHTSQEKEINKKLIEVILFRILNIK